MNFFPTGEDETDATMPLSLQPFSGMPGDPEKRIAGALLAAKQQQMASMFGGGLTGGSGGMPPLMSDPTQAGGITASGLGGLALDMLPGLLPSPLLRGAAGGGLELGKELLGGEGIQPGKILLKAGANALIPGGENLNIVTGAIRGLASSTLDSLANGEVPTTANMAISTLAGGMFGLMGKGAAKKIADQASLKEFFPFDEQGYIKQWAFEKSQQDTRFQKLFQEMADTFPQDSVAVNEKRAATKLARQQWAEGQSADQKWGVKFNKQNPPVLTKNMLTPIQASGLSWKDPRFAMEWLENKTGFPAYTKIWKPLYDARVKADALKTQFAVNFSNALPWRNRINGDVFQHWYEALEPDRAEIAKAANWGDKHFAIAQNYEDAWKPVLDWAGVQPEDFKFALREIRKYGFDQAFPAGGPPKMEFLKKIFQDDWLGRDVYSPSFVYGRISDSVAQQKLIAPTIKNIRDTMLKDTGDPYLRSLREQDPRAGAYVDWYLGKYDGPQANIISGVANAVMNTVNTTAKAIGVSAKLGRENLITPQQSEDLVQHIMQSPYVAALGYRPAAVFRNSLQGLMTAAPVMGKWYFKGLKETLSGSQASKDIAKDLEAYGLQAGKTIAGRTAEDETQAYTAMGRLGKAYANLALQPYSFIDDFHNRTIGIGQYMRVIDAAKKWDPLNASAFMRDSGIGTFFEDPLRKRWLSMAEQGKFRQLATESGVHMAYNTQWNRLAEKSQILDSLGVLGQFGNWPSHYAGYLSRVVASGDPSMRMENGKNFLRWVGANTAIAGSYNLAGNLLGVDPKEIAPRWAGDTFVGPAAWSGGPAAQLLTSWPEIVKNPTGAKARDKALLFTGLPVMAARDFYGLTQADQTRRGKSQVGAFFGVSNRAPGRSKENP